MGVNDRNDRTVAIVNPTRGTNSAGGISETDVETVEEWPCRVFPMNARLREYAGSVYGLSPTPDMLYCTGEYDVDALAALEAEGGAFLVDAANSERFKVVGVHPQQGYGDPNHLALVVQPQAWLG